MQSHRSILAPCMHQIGSDHISASQRHPKRLLKLKRYIERRYCAEVCLYIDDKCNIFVLVDGEFFCVSMEGRRPHLRRIRGHRLRKLIHCGLYGVEFESISCN
jgi:hypothetical protein